MSMFLEDLLKSKSYINSKGESVVIHSETGYEQCKFLQSLIKEDNLKNSIEIGFAYGISTVAITDAIAKNGGEHFVIDKFQYSEWGGMGLETVKKAGLDSKVNFFEKYSYEVLPQLLEAGKKFDFAYIDSTKQFDWLLVDFFYLDKLIMPGGLIVFDDVIFPGIRKLLRYLSQFPDYEVTAAFPQNYSQKKSRKVDLLCKVFPFLKRYLKDDYLLLDSELGINTHCVVLKKKNNDSRNWDWHKSF